MRGSARAEGQGKKGKEGQCFVHCYGVIAECVFFGVDAPEKAVARSGATERTKTGKANNRGPSLIPADPWMPGLRNRNRDRDDEKRGEAATPATWVTPGLPPATRANAILQVAEKNAPGMQCGA
jgi:hypothetical protein